MDAPSVSAGDYAVNIGTTGFDFELVFFPPPAPPPPPIPPNGPFRAVTGVRFSEIIDGVSSTFLVGDKHVPRGMESMQPWDCGIYDGHNVVCNTRAAGPAFPLAQTFNDPGWVFGSRHPAVVQFVFGDGHVHPLVRSIDPVVLGLLSQRNDGQPVPAY
jgi:hypothetical protein